MVNFENLDKFSFFGAGKYDIPLIKKTINYPKGIFIPANYAKTAKNPEKKIVHFFVHDYQFTRFWNTPDRYIPMLSRFEAICAPDFSMYTDMPLAMQIYNHYRKHWLAAYWQMHGLTVYPNIGWSTPDSYDWCFDGEPVGGIVVVSSVGTQAQAESRRLFLLGYEEMMRRLKPEGIIFYGKVPEECTGNIIRVRAFSADFQERCKQKRAESGGGDG